MLLQFSLAALLMQAAPTAVEPRLAGSSRNTPTDIAGFAVLRFLSTWRSAWLQGSDLYGFGHTDTRLRDVHCHWDGTFYATGGRGYYKAPGLIHNSSRRSMCPNWFPQDERTPDDERVSRDVSLNVGWRDRVHAARATLLDSLAMLDKMHPGDGWIIGQRVRFLVDQGELKEALDVARNCSSERSWCSELAGFVLHSAHEYARADSAFTAATAAMAPKERCEWTNVRLMLDKDGRSAYDHINCEARVATNERIWWLSTPLFSDSVNDRRSEQFARKVMVHLHSALPWDERYDWRPHYGGEAVSEMLMRYGWPAISVFGGSRQEIEHAGWMTFYDSTRTATSEYTQDRLHLVPEWSAVTDATHADAEAWQLNMPQIERNVEEPAAIWWPAEHYARDNGGILQLTEQTVMLRRDNDVLLATAAELPNNRKLNTDSTKSFLMRTTGPGVIESVPHQSFKNPNALVITAHIPKDPAVVGSEFVANRVGDMSARTRFGVTPPAPLSTFKKGETAISDPVLIASTVDAPMGADVALQQMLGSARVRGAKVGVYWETYGYAPGDSVDVAVVILRHEKLSRIRRLGMKLHLADDINGSVAVRWQEPQAGHDSWSIPGRLPIQARSVRIDLSHVSPGNYIVQVLVGHRGGVPVIASREFVYEGK